MNRLSFMENNNINDFFFFVGNYAKIMTVMDICSGLNISKISDLVIQDNSVTFSSEMPKGIKSASDIPISAPVNAYGESYQLNFNNNNDVLNINMEVSTL